MHSDYLLTINEVAERLRIHRTYVYKLIRQGKLPRPIKLGCASRVRASELEQAIRAF